MFNTNIQCETLILHFKMSSVGLIVVSFLEERSQKKQKAARRERSWCEFLTGEKMGSGGVWKTLKAELHTLWEDSGPSVTLVGTKWHKEKWDLKAEEQRAGSRIKQLKKGYHGNHRSRGSITLDSSGRLLFCHYRERCDVVSLWITWWVGCKISSRLIGESSTGHASQD